MLIVVNFAHFSDAIVESAKLLRGSKHRIAWLVINVKSFSKKVDLCMETKLLMPKA
jgi:hypothetical protein